MPGEGQGFRGVAGDSGVRHVVAGGLDASRLVAAHVLECDAPAHVGEQLGQGARHGTGVVAERVDEGLLRLGVHLPTGGPHVGGDERQLVAVVLQRVGGDHRPLGLRDRVGDFLAAGVAAGVGQEHPYVGRGGGRVGDQVGGERVAHGLQVPDYDHAGFAEQRG